MAVRLLKRFSGDSQYPYGLDANYIYDGPQQDYFLQIGTADRQIELATDFQSYNTSKPNALYPIDRPGEETAVNNLWAASQGFSKIGGIRTVLIGQSFEWLASHDDTAGGTALVYDSASGTSYYQGGTFANTTDYGWFTWADALMMAPHYLIANSGVGGNTMAQIEARLDADCIRYNPELVYLAGGRNSFKAGLKFEPVRDSMLRCLDRLSAINAFVCIIDVFPSADLSSVSGAAVEAAKFNRWLVGEVRRRRSCALVSGCGVMVDPDVAQAGAALSNVVLLDGVHNNNLGAFKVGDAVAKVMTPIVRPWANYPSSPTEGWDYSNTDDQEIRSSNPLMFGTGGTLTTGMTGSIATGYDVARNGGGGTQTAVLSKVADREGVGLAQRLAMTFAADGDGVRFGLSNTSIHARFVANKVMQHQCDVTFVAGSAAIINRVEMVVSAIINGVAYNGRTMQRVVSSADHGVANNIQPLDLAGRTMRLRSPRWYFPSGPCTQLNHFITFYGSGAGTVTADVSRYAVRQFALA